ncbi:prepilin-type N-terminal cleavage/methylation domain-containing protein [Thalassotalea euphylliae]|uniref:Prepilin-type N-terminal cleavage/methylation domain-containing protein n=2 Tax=Thalassotalea euphylliae TaxID=1655234 RepID=A0A3E0UDA9_9GAMM|nr:prepilin-type N-terminal cleavage/methylation domain-containing protein [Thalassotalea euphylliae]
MTNYNSCQLRSRGYTLIELLVVIAIVASLIGLVGPLTIDSVAKYQSRVQVTEVKSLFSKYSTLAFLRGEQVRLVINGNSISRVYANEEQDVFTFEHIQFSPIEIYFSPSGIPNVNELDLQVRENIISINLLEVLYES